jgi:S-adenosylmethionine-dependent methyltransferase
VTAERPTVGRAVPAASGAACERGTACEQGTAQRYAAYLATPPGRLRCEVAFQNLAAYLPETGPGGAAVRALDLGGGTGELAIRLARRGLHVTLLDRSAQMLDIAERAVRQAGVGSRVVLTRGDAAAAPALFGRGVFDVVTCHHVLEYVETPADILRAAAHVLRPASTSLVSVIGRNRAGAVVRAAIQAGDLEAAQRVLATGEADEPLFGGRVRLFTPAALRAMLLEASLLPVAERGVRILVDYLAPSTVRDAGDAGVVAFEQALGMHAEFSALARYTHVLARPRARARGNGGV